MKRPPPDAEVVYTRGHAPLPKRRRPSLRRRPVRWLLLAGGVLALLGWQPLTTSYRAETQKPLPPARVYITPIPEPHGWPLGQPWPDQYPNPNATLAAQADPLQPAAASRPSPTTAQVLSLGGLPTPSLAARGPVALPGTPSPLRSLSVVAQTRPISSTAPTATPTSTPSPRSTPTPTATPTPTPRPTSTPTPTPKPKPTCSTTASGPRLNDDCRR